MLAEQIVGYANETLQYRIYNDLKLLPPFDPEQSMANTPQKVLEMRSAIQDSAAVIFCTPEYVFSIPSGLKNLIEWCVSTTVFENKPLGILTASSHGQKGHEELQRIMKTLMALFTAESTLLIQGIKGKMDANGAILNPETDEQIRKFIRAVQDLAMQQ